MGLGIPRSKQKVKLESFSKGDPNAELSYDED